MVVMMKEDEKLGPVEELSAGCPFAGFEKCRGERCAFFVKTFSDDPDDARECIIRSAFALQLQLNLAVQLQSATHLCNNRSRPGGDVFALRAVESFRSSLLKLDGLLAHPKTGYKLKQRIRELKSGLLALLKTFSES